MESKKYPIVNGVRVCSVHNIPARSRPDGKPWCTECQRQRRQNYTKQHPFWWRKYRDYRYKTGKTIPMHKAKDCALYLGVVVAENVLSKFFDNITKMPHGNPGYDFICGKGYKIDVKSSCIYQHNKSTRWVFMIYKNTIADYFLCLGFDNRENLEPQHVWLIPGHVVNHVKHLPIPNSNYGIKRWSQYERPIDRVTMCCNAMRDGSKVIA